MIAHAFTRVLPDDVESLRAVCACGVVRRVRYTLADGYVREYGRDGTWQHTEMAHTITNGATT